MKRIVNRVLAAATICGATLGVTACKQAKAQEDNYADGV